MWTRFFAAGAALALSAAPVAAQTIEWDRDVVLRVGQSQVFAAARARCGKTDIPDWPTVLDRLPRSSLGAFSDGGEGVVKSRSCDGDTPARAIRFTAKKPGQETLEIYSTTVTFTVR